MTNPSLYLLAFSVFLFLAKFLVKWGKGRTILSNASFIALFFSIIFLTYSKLLVTMDIEFEVFSFKVIFLALFVIVNLINIALMYKIKNDYVLTALGMFFIFNYYVLPFTSIFTLAYRYILSIVTVFITIVTFILIKSSEKTDRENKVILNWVTGTLFIVIFVMNYIAKNDFYS